MAGWVADADRTDLVEVDRVDDSFEEVIFEECFDLWPLVVLKGFAMGARLGSPVGLAALFVEVFAGFAAGCFLVAAVSIAYDVRPAVTARKRSAAARRRNNIYCTPMGFAALFGWLEVSEMTGAGSFGWGPG